MNNYLLLIAVVLFSNVVAQEQPSIFEFPQDQDYYSGGKPQLYREMHQILKDQKFTNCSESESYEASVLIAENSKVRFVKDFDSATIEANKCAYDMFRKVLPHLKNWKPASVQGQPVQAIAKIPFLPSVLFENYVDGLVIKSPTNAEFPGGIRAFRREFANHFDLSAIGRGGRAVSVEIGFVVNQQGIIEDVNIAGNDKQLIKEAHRAIDKIKAKWVPATFNGLPVRARFRLPIKLEFARESEAPQNQPHINPMFQRGMHRSTF